MERGLISSIIVIVLFSTIGITYFLIPAELAQALFLPSLAVIVVVCVSLFAWYLSSPHYKIERRLIKIGKVLFHESIDILEHLYMEIYEIYIKLSEEHKGKYYPKVKRIRETLEGHLIAEKKVETLLFEAKDKPLQELKKLYDELYTHFSKLPHKIQGRYYAQIVHLRQKMERGK